MIEKEKKQGKPTWCGNEKDQHNSGSYKSKT